MFEQYGLPQALRVDNGGPWGKVQNTPCWLALWLTGLGIEMKWNRPHTPKDNAKIERSNRLIDDLSEPQQCASSADWQTRLNQMIALQRDQYPNKNGLTRTQLHPEFYANPHAYKRQDEADQWELSRVKQLLSQFEWQRIVSTKGQVTVMNQRIFIGNIHKHSKVMIRFDPTDTSYVVKTLLGALIVRAPATDITTEVIMSLSSTARKKKRQTRCAKT